MINFDQTAPFVSVCIANYNGDTIIAACIASVLAQDCGFPVEIIVHDDASSDESVEILRRDYPQVRLLESKENVGFCVSNNRMAAVANGEYLLLLNNDATLLPGALAALSQCAISMEKPAILTLPQYHAETRQLIDAGCFLDPFLNPVPNLDINKKDVGMVIGACLWIPKILWDQIGGFPEWFGSLAEDLYICCVARLWGYRVIALPDSGYLHAVGHSFGGGKAEKKRLTISKKRRQLSERNKNIAMLLCYPAVMLVLIFPMHILLLLIEGAVLSILKGKADLFFDIYWNSLKSLWSLRSLILEKRRQTQQTRASALKDFAGAHIWYPHKISLLFKYGLPR
jgi:GT2 family glycosyltransferase